MVDLKVEQSEIPRLAVTIGDPAGIGAEIVLKALADSSLTENFQITIIGTYPLLKQTYEQLRCKSNSDLIAPDKLDVLDISIARQIEENIIIGRGNAASGAASFAYLDAAIARTLAGEFDAIVTAPIAKSLWKQAGYDYPGQTEVLAQKAEVEKYGMLFVARSPHTDWTLRTLLATTHIPLDRVSASLNPQLMTLKLELLIDCLDEDFGIDTPTIAIAGLNPHSGEEGQLGSEEKEWLIPWLEEQQKNRPKVQLIGPIPPDTMWVKPGQAWYNNSKIDSLADAYLALYHDQGLIPVKLMAFDRAINTTIGLPFVRTSPDHGTAFDIAGKGIANASSMKEAIKLAAELTRQRNTFANV
jgi:4-hydroxythreonine-4-phosphate dehydrogenase